MDMKTHHRLFVQYMLQKGAVSADQAVNYCQNFPGDSIKDLTQLKVAILTINKHISQQSFKICVATCEVTNQEMLVWANLKDDSIAKHAHTYKPIELEYFHVLLQELANHEEHKLKFVAVLNMTSSLTSAFTLSRGEAVLKKWIEQGFYVLHDGFIYLGPRLIAEFGSYFKNRGFESCRLCSELVFTGKKCSMCDRTLHSCCLMKYLVTQERCPSCKNHWMEKTHDINLATTQELRNFEVDDGEIPSTSRTFDRSSTSSPEPSTSAEDSTQTRRSRPKRPKRT